MKHLVLCLMSLALPLSPTYGAEGEQPVASSLGGLQGEGFSLGIKIGAGALSSPDYNDDAYYKGARSSHILALETQYRSEKDWSYGVGVETVGIRGDAESSLLLFTPKLSRTLPWQIGADTRWSLGVELGAGAANQFEGSQRLAKGDAYRLKASLDWEILGDIPIFFLPGAIWKIETDKTFGYKFALSASQTHITTTRIYSPESKISKANRSATELMLEFGVFYNHNRAP